MSDYIKIGNVQKTHGIKGELTCHIQIAPDDFDDLNSIFIKQGGTLVPYFITSYQFNQDRLTLSL
ncbi:MAG TPA: hypothetical protein VL947_06290, partial [Cytophagales bacterium]|nr:hypothetical protein [Cytophagales bacterium]